MAKDQDTASAVQAAPAPEHHLVVIHPFGDFKRGDLITDADQIDAIKASENAHHLHKVTPA